MPIELLTLLKFGLLLLLYAFLARTVRAVVTEIYGPRRRSSAPRPAVAMAPETRRSRKVPKEIVVHPVSGSPSVVGLTGDSVRLGRADHVDVPLDDVYVSDEHAEIIPGDGVWSVRDLGSTNGTFLNGAKVTRPTPLAPGDQLRIGKTRIEVRR